MLHIHKDYYMIYEYLPVSQQSEENIIVKRFSSINIHFLLVEQWV